jgi:peptide/nickel transport system substrate-binding protein
MHVDTAQVIAGQLERIGVEVSIKLVDWPTWYSDVYQGRNFMATIISLDSAVVSARNFLARYNSAASGNFFNYKSAEFDAIYNAILTEMDEAKRIQLYKQAQRVIARDAANVYIQDILYYRAFRSGAYSGVLNYPLYITDFASIYGIDKN